jgi:hypothetical protein
LPANMTGLDFSFRLWVNHSDLLMTLSSFSKLKENYIKVVATVPPF